MRLHSRPIAWFAVALVVLGVAACRGESSQGRVNVVAAIYPLAWAAEQVGGDLVDVEDLTPPGVEAHDASVTAAQRADIQTADIVVYLGEIDFQPDVERAVDEAGGRVIDVTAELGIRPRPGDTFDPHLWLDSADMEEIVRLLADALEATDPPGADGYARREEAALGVLEDLDASFREGLSGCAFTTFVVTHEAFGYLAGTYGFRQLGIEGLTPESEPSAARIQAAAAAIDQERAAPVVFYEETDAGRRVGQSVAESVGVPALPLNTLESDPAPLDYISAMEENLTNLREGLRCGT
ncbi:MAG: metal ABC transporter substrate-binding protein [Actinomycetota bacterium]